MERTLDEAVAAFDDDALLKMMVAQVARTFPKFDGAPEPVKRARDRFVALASAAPVMREALVYILSEHAAQFGKCGCGICTRASEVLRAADGQGER